MFVVSGVRDVGAATAPATRIVAASTGVVERESAGVTSDEPEAEPEVGAPDPSSIVRAVVHVQTEASAGSGFVVSDRHVVTNAHVVGDASVATVWFSNGARREGQIVATDTRLDFAVLEVPRVPVSVEPLAIADVQTAITLGAPVWAWGYPFEDAVVEAGFSRAPSVSAGIVSAQRLRDGVSYLQTDAAVNPGSSGGPLLGRERSRGGRQHARAHPRRRGRRGAELRARCPSTFERDRGTARGGHDARLASLHVDQAFVPCGMDGDRHLHVLAEVHADTGRVVAHEVERVRPDRGVAAGLAIWCA